MNAKRWRRISGTLTLLLSVQLFIQSSLALGEDQTTKLIMGSALTQTSEVALYVTEYSSTTTVSETSEATVTPDETETPTPEGLSTDMVSTPPPDTSATPDTSETPAPEACATPTPEVSAAPVPEASAAPTPAASEAPDVTDSSVQTMALIPILAADAQGLSATGDLSGGGISFSNFSSIVLDGTTQKATAVWSIGDVIDNSGTGNGWNVSLTLTPFKECSGTEYVTNGAALRTSSVIVSTIPIVTQMDEGSTPAEQIVVISMATAMDTGTPVKLLTSGAGIGMGSYSMSAMTVTLTVPADAYAHMYKTDATIALVSGP